MGVLGSTSSSVFIVGPGGALGSKLPAIALSAKTTKPAKTNTLTTTFVLFFCVCIFVSSKKLLNLTAFGRTFLDRINKIDQILFFAAKKLKRKEDIFLCFCAFWWLIPIQVNYRLLCEYTAIKGHIRALLLLTEQWFLAFHRVTSQEYLYVIICCCPIKFKKK